MAANDNHKKTAETGAEVKAAFHAAAQPQSAELTDADLAEQAHRGEIHPFDYLVELGNGG